MTSMAILAMGWSGASEKSRCIEVVHGGWQCPDGVGKHGDLAVGAGLGVDGSRWQEVVQRERVGVRVVDAVVVVVALVGIVVVVVAAAAET